MEYTPKILAFAGSTRIESFSKKLIKIAVSGARAAGAEAGQGLSENAKKFKELMLAHEAFSADGTLKDPKQHKAIEKLGADVAQILMKLNHR